MKLDITHVACSSRNIRKYICCDSSQIQISNLVDGRRAEDDSLMAGTSTMGISCPA